MTNAELAGLLREYAGAKKKLLDLRARLIQVAVEDFHVDQAHAKNQSLESFFDGYLVGQGVMPAWRKPPEIKA